MDPVVDWSRLAAEAEYIRSHLYKKLSQYAHFG